MKSEKEANKMIKVRLCESYPNAYWNSANGVTISKDDRDGQLVDENNRMVRLALEGGFLELVTADSVPKSRIISDVPTKKTIKEVVTPANDIQMEKIREEANGN